jgi:peptide deformylase
LWIRNGSGSHIRRLTLAANGLWRVVFSASLVYFIAFHLDCRRACAQVAAMATLPILEFPDPRLRTRAREVVPADFTPVLQQLIDDMFETMYEAPGIGLAATQVDHHLRFMVMDVSEDKSAPRVFINPQIVESDGHQVYQEGCLSVPGIFADVTRANQITVRAMDRHGKPFDLKADGLLAVCIQHEMDHLDGKVFVDYLSPLKRDLVRKKLAKQRRGAS